jgi:hypothetical protein
LDSAKPPGAFGGAQNTTKVAAPLLVNHHYSALMDQFQLRLQKGMRLLGTNQLYYCDKSCWFTAGLSSAPSLSISSNKPVGFSSAGFGAGNLIVLLTYRGSPLPQQTIGKTRNFKLGTMFDTKQNLPKSYTVHD